MNATLFIKTSAHVRQLNNLIDAGQALRANVTRYIDTEFSEEELHRDIIEYERQWSQFFSRN